MATTPLAARPENRTNGRFLKWWGRLESTLLPAHAEVRVAAAFGRPRRPRSQVTPEVPGEAGRPFELESARGRLVAWEWGGGPTVLLVHGWNGVAAQMTAFVPPLLAAGYGVAALDLPAHGGSDGEETTVLGMADAVAQLASRLKPVHGVIAHSLGATASVLALTKGASLGRMVLLAPPVEVPHFARRFAASLGLPPPRVEGVVARVRQRLGVDLDALDLRRLAPQVMAPLLVLHDPTDREVPFEPARAFASGCADARFEALRWLGHRRPLRDAGVVRDATEFLRTPGAGSARRAG